MNKIYHFLNILLLLSLSFSCASQSQDDFVDTKWVYDFGGCQNVITIKNNNNYSYYSCETRDTVSGDYLLKRDTLIFYQNKSSSDKEFKNNSKHHSSPLKFKLLLNDDSLRFIERWELSANDNWYKSNFNFSSDFVFKKKD